MGLGQYNNLGEYCDPYTASPVFLILLLATYVRGFMIKMTSGEGGGGARVGDHVGSFHSLRPFVY